MIKHIHDEGRKVAALCGSPSQARKHADAGVDIIIAQGGEAGGHCGEVGSIVLWPQVVKEVAPGPCWPPADRQRPADRGRTRPRRSGCMDRFAVGHGGGSREYAECSRTPTSLPRHAQHRALTIVYRQTGADAGHDWTDAWEDRTTRSRSACRCSHGVGGGRRRHPPVSRRDGRRRVQPVGQVVGQFTKVEKTSAVIERWVQEYLEATNTLNELNEAADRLIAAAPAPAS